MASSLFSFYIPVGAFCFVTQISLTMSAASSTAVAASYISRPNCTSLTPHVPICRSSSSLRSQPSLTRSIFFRIPCGFSKRSSVLTVFRPLSPVMQWQDCTVKTEIDVPISVAYNCYSDREAIPQWMPFISTVKVLEAKPELSRWSLKYRAFGRDIEFSWLARNMQPTRNQKIHWRSVEGLPNRGAVRFYPKGASSCIVELTVSYEVPGILAPVASALQPFTESLLARGLERFATFAKSYKSDATV